MLQHSFLSYIICCICLTVTYVWTPAASAEEKQNSMVSGKIVSPVTRARPLPFNAVVTEVLVNAGDAVKENQIIMRYELTEENERILQKEVTLGASTENIRGQVLDLERQLASIIAERNKARQLAGSGLGSKNALARIEGDVNSLQQRINLLKQTATKNEENFKGRLKELSDYFGTPIKAGSTLPKGLVLTSPIDGYVLSVAPNLYAGTQLSANTAPISVGKMDPMLIQVQVYEGEIGQISVGDVVKVVIPSLQNKTFTATVTQIAWTSNNMNVDAPSYFTVELTVPNPDNELKPGFKAIVHFSE